MSSESNSSPHPGMAAASTPMTSKGEHTAIPNKAPAFTAPMGTASSLGGQSPGTRHTAAK